MIDKQYDDKIEEKSEEEKSEEENDDEQMFVQPPKIPNYINLESNNTNNENNSEKIKDIPKASRTNGKPLNLSQNKDDGSDSDDGKNNDNASSKSKTSNTSGMSSKRNNFGSPKKIRRDSDKFSEKTDRSKKIHVTEDKKDKIENRKIIINNDDNDDDSNDINTKSIDNKSKNSRSDNNKSSRSNRSSLPKFGKINIVNDEFDFEIMKKKLDEVSNDEIEHEKEILSSKKIQIKKQKSKIQDEIDASTAVSRKDITQKSFKII